MVQRYDYETLYNKYLFLAVIIDPSAEYRIEAPMRKIHLRYTEIVADSTGNMRLQRQK